MQMVSEIKTEQKQQNLYDNFKRQAPEAAKDWSQSFYPDKDFD